MADEQSDLDTVADIKRERDRRRRQHTNTAPQVLSPPTAPMAVARQFVGHYCLHNGAANELTLRYWRGGWWAWRTAHWAEAEERNVRALLYAFTENAVYPDGAKTKPWLPTRRKIGDLLEALSTQVILSDEIEQPCWLDHRNMAGPVVAVGNGLLDISTKRLHAHSPLFFNTTSVPFDYDPRAPAPAEWLAFLAALWPQEPAAIDALGEWFGYVASGRTDLHKILLMVGPTRGGKGTIARLLQAMIGKQNSCGPTLNSLGGEFGLAPLIGKSLAIISDARFAGRNGGVVVERLLSISGEDSLTVNVKFKQQWFGKLPCRLHVLSNELPRLGDASSAIIGRMVLLPLTFSWLGREDYDLEPRILAELTGILNWSLEGLERLTIKNRNRFTGVESATEAIITMRNLASPVGAFVRERCVVGADKTVEIAKLYEAYKSWCEDNENPKLSKEVFGRDLRAAVPSIRVTQLGTAPRIRAYQGLGLRTATDDAGDGEALL